MRLFYDNEFFIELAINRFLKSVNYETPLARNTSYLWGDDRLKWHELYNPNVVVMHPIKANQFKIPSETRKRYCGSVLQTWSDILFHGARNFITKMGD
ncbi:hypothetical protein GCK72_019168 [Caenorhabditis remanei]|uniref:Uncharacterized protein n=1 Tax=Caenorhabditis remanei TaxID=31234 RepID=A0A6A5GD65_CAERE|nr:hypothetical protein GCK72_019168 [Caenorhabditis remanei]KAF1752613.1 hypothetical protein GCK72_019168 [Caenorhabditis remanei]